MLKNTSLIVESRGFPGGSVIKNLPAKVGDKRSIPGAGRSHMSWENKAHAPQLLCLGPRALEPQLLKSMHPRAHALHQEKIQQWEGFIP